MGDHNAGTKDSPTFATLVEMLRQRADTQESRRAFTFLGDGERVESHMTYGALDRRARAIAASLQPIMKAGERALILYPPSLEYIGAFFGCLYAGVIAVPAYPPDPSRLQRTLPRLLSIIEDAEIDVVLTTSELLQMASFLFGEAKQLARLNWIATDVIDDATARTWLEPDVDSRHLAFLQYTSGSTGDPKGVMLSHGNLLHNQQLIRRGFGIDADSVVVSWLPMYHDMGLIGNVIQPIYSDIHSILMSPIDFLKRPFRWVQAMSTHQATVTVAPNFAYDLVVRKTTPEQRDTLDLSRWRLAASGAEPIRAETLHRFLQFFEPVGVRPEILLTCYGLAESTLLVTSSCVGRTPTELRVRREELERHRVVNATPQPEGTATLVSSGLTWDQYDLAIVDPHTLAPVADEQVGEVWLRGPSVAHGYWRRKEQTREVFHAYLAGSEQGPYLRTGDLGFLKDGQLYITGRLKDLIIIRGANHYPQDIEHTVEDVHVALRPGCGAAFAVATPDGEELVVVHEFDASAGASPQVLTAGIVEAVAVNHDISPGAVVLIEARSIEKTSSGKIRRRATREAFLGGALEEVHRWLNPRSGLADAAPQPDKPPTQPSSAPTTASKKSARAREIERWLTAQLAADLKVSGDCVDLRAPFSTYGLSSLEAVSLVGELEAWLAVPIPTATLYDYPTVEGLAAHLAGDLRPDGQSASKPALERRRSLDEPVAIVGVGCRFPGAPNVQAFWQMLLDGREGILEVPADRWDVDAWYDAELSGFDKMNTRRGGFLEHIDRFDPAFFGISLREADAMDPQQRLVLEVAWETLENAGINPGSLRGTRTGVYLGLSSHDFGAMYKGIPPRAATGMASSVAANRLSYLLHLHGPSMTVDTACSSSLVAIDLAMQALRLSKCDGALVGGVNVILTPVMTVAFSQARMIAPDGRCKTFDAEADGYVRGEGCGMIFLKRLSDAVKDGDRVLAVVRGAAVNQDGQSNGMTAPNGLAQQAVIREALVDAGVAPRDVAYVEAHGTGTPLGDAIEVRSLQAVFGEERPAERKCLLGSVKTNIGHLEAGAGIAGVIKTTLALHHGRVPAHLNFATPNPECAFEQTVFVVPRETVEWPHFTEGAASVSRYAGVSSFGFGGTNAHVVLEGPPQVSRRTSQRERPAHLLTISARSKEALTTLAGSYAEVLTELEDASLADVAFSANAGRAHFEERLALCARAREEARDALVAFARGEERIPALWHGRAAGTKAGRIAFLFTGQGAQYPGMGRDLFETQPTFRRALQRCAEIVDPHLEAPLLSVLYPEDAQDGRIHETAFAQPSLFALEYALWELWRSFGVEPDVVMGHSVGEYVAACAAGVFGLEDGLRLIAERGRLMQSLPRDGAMAVVFASEDEVAEALAPVREHVAIAAVNGPRVVVVSGRSAEVAHLIERFEAEGVFTQALNASHAFHSPLMTPILDAFESFAAGFESAAPRIALVSNLSGALVGEEQVLGARYWREHIRSPVRFCQGIETLDQAGVEIYLELGPSPTLVGMGRRCLGRGKGTWLGSLTSGTGDWEPILAAVATLYTRGVDVDWKGFDRDWRRDRISLPNYPFERRTCWPRAGEIHNFRAREP
jgi:acyl transferase domain-containing protein/acyl-CoA synthetase (AMP-forming)/AMP-acid ligase II/acyl carrier protein